jgi:hypothetical protein
VENKAYIKTSFCVFGFTLFFSVGNMTNLSRDSSVGIAMAYGLDCWGSIPGMDK